MIPLESRFVPAIAQQLPIYCQHVRWSWQEVEINWSSPPFAILLWPLTSQYRAQENPAWPNRLGWCMWPWQRLTNGEQPPQQGCLEQPFFLRGGPKAKICRAGRGRDREKQHENSKFFCRLMRKEFLQMLILHQYAIVQLSHYLAPYQIIVAEAADAVSVNFSGRCKFFSDLTRKIDNLLCILP